MRSALSAGLQDVRKPSTRWRCTYFYLLRVGTTWCTEGEDTPSPPLPCFAARTAGLGWGARPGMASPLATESQSQSPGTCPWPGLVGGLPTPQMGWKTRPLAIPTLALLRMLENSCPLAFGEPIQPSLSCQGPPGHCGRPLSVRHSWTHPVSSTLSPHTVFVQSAPFYIRNPTHTSSAAPAPTPKGGRNCEPSATRIRSDMLR